MLSCRMGHLDNGLKDASVRSVDDMGARVPHDGDGPSRLDLTKAG